MPTNDGLPAPAGSGASAVSGECTCWQLPGRHGTRIPAADVLHLAGITVTTADGVTNEGRPFAVCWAGPADRRRRHLLVCVLKNSDDVVLAINEDTLDELWQSMETPYWDLTRESSDPPLLVQAVSELAAAQSHGETVRHVVPGEGGETITVTITRSPHICLPGPDPYARPS